MREDFMTFVHHCFAELHPAGTLSDAGYLRVMAAKLADTLPGRGPKRLIINLPARSLKSVMVSVAAVAYVLGLDPTKQIICASYGKELTTFPGQVRRPNRFDCSSQGLHASRQPPCLGDARGRTNQLPPGDAVIDGNLSRFSASRTRRSLWFRPQTQCGLYKDHGLIEGPR